MRKLIQPRAAQGAGSVSVYHDWKAEKKQKFGCSVEIHN